MWTPDVCFDTENYGHIHKTTDVNYALWVEGPPPLSFTRKQTRN